MNSNTHFSTNNKEKILDVAIELFQNKGFKDTHMKEVAKLSKFSLGDLKNIYPNKDNLFKNVFIELYGRIAPQLQDILDGNMPVFEKIRHFTNNYALFINRNRFLPLGLLRKINPNTDFAKEFIVNLKMPNPDKFYQQVANEIQLGNILPINPKTLLINIFALSVFPHVASPLMKDFIKADNEEFEAIKNHSNTFVADFIINSIKAK